MIHGMHVHWNGLHIHQYQNTTLLLLPQVNSSEAFWDAKKKGHELFTGELEKIHMPNNSGLPFIMSCIFFVWGFSFVFAIWSASHYCHNRNFRLFGSIVHLKKIMASYFCRRN